MIYLLGTALDDDGSQIHFSFSAHVTGDQIVGATIYFDNMSSEETADLLKTLNRHKVGLKLQNKTGDKSPCRSPMGTLSWEGRAGFGGSSSDILLVS